MSFSSVIHWFLGLWIAILVQSCFGYKPVFIIHGILSKNVSMKFLEKRIQEVKLTDEATARKSLYFLKRKGRFDTESEQGFDEIIQTGKIPQPCFALRQTSDDVHPTTEVFVSSRYINLGSLEPMWRQVEKIGQEMMNFSYRYPEGIHLIGYSQGGLIARGILEKYSDHNVKTFISLSSPQAGQYGTKFLHIVFPNLIKETAYKIFYTAAGQLTSVGNYWNDPHQQPLYYNYSVFLPKLNNEIACSRNPGFTNGLLRLQKFVLIGGPDDEVITPWQSSIFGYFKEDETIEDVRERKIYTEDYFGLKTLDEENKLKIVTLSGVRHLAWRKNLSVIDNHIIPYLD